MASSGDVVMKKFQFRKFLTELSDRLSGENLKAMKNLCYDFITGRQRDELDTGIALFNILIEQNIINYEKVQFLCDVLDSVGRKDLTEDVKEYIARQEVPQAVQPDGGYMYELNFPILKVIATEVGRDWKMLARHLGLDEGIIQGIHQANFGDLHEAALQSLLRWQKEAGPKATPRALKQALTDMRLMSIVHNHFEGVV